MHKLKPFLRKTWLVFGVLFAVLALRIYQLSILQHDYFVQEARKPKHKIRISHPQRGHILDRFGTPLAINKTQYNVSILYSDVRSIPWIQYKIIEGKKQKIFSRKEYIEKLASLVENICHLDKEWVQDEIYAKAALLPTHPYPLKLDISEKEFAQIKIAEKDFPGLVAERTHKRFYPHGKTACHLLGYLGSIDQNEYHKIASEIRSLEQFLYQRKLDLDIALPKDFASFQEVEHRLNYLKQKAYTTRDQSGKAGIEKSYDEDLRGFAGVNHFETDVFGNVVLNLSQSKKAIKGKDVRLSIMLELQEFAEKELIKLENMEPNQRYFDKETNSYKNLQIPQMKGSSLLVMDPKTSHIYAFASYPRFDPNDFVEKDTAQIHKWLETKRYKQHIFERKIPFEKECFFQNQIVEIPTKMDLKHYLLALLPPNHRLFSVFNTFNTLQKVIHLQTSLDLLCIEHNLSKKALLTREDLLPKTLKAFHLSAYDRMLFCDLLQLFCKHTRFDQEVLSFMQDRTLDEHCQDAKEYSELTAAVKDMVHMTFKETVFAKWREEYFSQFLKEKRQMEKEKNTYARPFTEYLSKKEQEMFIPFWQEHETACLSSFLLDVPLDPSLKAFEKILHLWKKEIANGAHVALLWVQAYKKLKTGLHLLPASIAKRYLNTFVAFEDLKHDPLIGYYPQLGKRASLEDLALGFYPKYGFGHTKHLGYQEPITIGSLFKLVTAYSALFKQYLHQEPIHNPLVIYDSFEKDPQTQKMMLAKNQKGEAILQHYKGGRLIKSQRRNIGWINLKGAIEASSNPYFSLLAQDYIQNPLHLFTTAKGFGFTKFSNIDLPYEKRGQIPFDLFFNPSSLYSFAIGQNVLATNLQAALMLTAIANHGIVHSPKVVYETEGQEPNFEIMHFFNTLDYPHKDLLKKVSVHFPLILNTKQLFENQVQKLKNPPLLKVEMPKAIERTLLDGMKQVVLGKRGTCYYELIPSKSFKRLKDQLFCKTSSSEVTQTISFDEKQHHQIYKHTWLGIIYYENNQPELVIVINLRFGRAGRTLAPLAASIIEKFKELKP
ncbi:MAG: Penicillin-binding protein 2 [Chlamydiae bacterium]|nr:Penicillin-binding protein 2 [Chlamydiota bacterium]